MQRWSTCRRCNQLSCNNIISCKDITFKKVDYVQIHRVDEGFFRIHGHKINAALLAPLEHLSQDNTTVQVLNPHNQSSQIKISQKNKRNKWIVTALKQKIKTEFKLYTIYKHCTCSSSIYHLHHHHHHQALLGQYCTSHGSPQTHTAF